MTEGYIKYSCEFIESAPIESELTQELTFWRDKLFELNLIGEYENGIGFGNISASLNNKDKHFLISGTRTGGLSTLTARHYALVEAYNFEKNFLKCSGPLQASSESMTHASIYEEDLSAAAVVHIHHLALWQKLLNTVPTTSDDATYGTPEMAYEISRLFRETDIRSQKILTMGGHEEGIISFGESLEQACAVMLEHYYSI